MTVRADAGTIVREEPADAGVELMIGRETLPPPTPPSARVGLNDDEELSMSFRDSAPTIGLVVLVALVFIVALRKVLQRSATPPDSKLGTRIGKFAAAKAAKTCAIVGCPFDGKHWYAIVVEVRRPLYERLVRRGRGAPIAEYRVGDDHTCKVCAAHRAESLADADMLLVDLAKERLEQEALRAAKVRTHRVKQYEKMCQRQKVFDATVVDPEPKKANGAATAPPAPPEAPAAPPAAPGTPPPPAPPGPPN